MKIDTAKIPGFDALSDEQKNAIIAMEFPDEVDMKQYVKKEQFDTAAHEASEWKKKYNAQVADETTKSGEKDREIEEMKATIAEIKKKETVSNFTSKFLAQGYDEGLARETASALADGDMEKVFANQQTFNSGREEAVKKRLLENTPRTPAGTGTSEKDYKKMADEARANGDIARQAAYIRLSQQEEK